MFACMHVCMCARLYVRVYVCARDACACACACACVCVCAYTAEQLAGLPRLRKMLDRMSDLSNFACERHNATMAVHTSLDFGQTAVKRRIAAFGVWRLVRR